MLKGSKAESRRLETRRKVEYAVFDHVIKEHFHLIINTFAIPHVLFLGGRYSPLCLLLLTG